MTAKFNAIGLVVTDMKAAVTFYRAIGLDLPESAGAEPHVDIDLGGGMRMMLDSEEMIKGILPNYQPASGVWGALAFECGSPAEVDRLYAELTEAGHHGEVPPYDAFWGQRYATVHDPDGNGVDLYAALPS